MRSTVPTWKRSFVYGFALAVAVSVAGYVLMSSSYFSWVALLGMPGFVSGMTVVSASGNAIEMKIMAVAALVNGLLYTLVVHGLRRIWAKLRA